MHTHESQQQPDQGGQDAATALELLYPESQGEVVGHQAVRSDHIRWRILEPTSQGGARDVQLGEKARILPLPDEQPEPVVVDALAGRRGEHGRA